MLRTAVLCRYASKPSALALAAAAIAVLAFRPGPAQATILRITTTLGDIDVRMFDVATPASVQNFLNYVNDDDLDGSFFHRAPKQFRRDEFGLIELDDDGQPIIDTFVLQGGGFTFTDAAGLGSVPTDQPVVNEPGLSNLPGTIAYAKLGGNPNSATSGFFFNTVDNSANLDFQNGGFTAFARIVRGQDVLEAITDLNIFDIDPAPEPTPDNPMPENPSLFDNVPLLNIPASLENNFIYVIDAAVLNLADGDYDFDGDVDLDDYQVWQELFGSSLRIADQPAGSLPGGVDGPLMDADGNGDGVVDAADYTVWRDGFVGSATATPEPSGLVVGLVLSIAAWRRRTKKA